MTKSFDPHVPGIRHQVNGIALHCIESGPEDGPLVILLHGFPEFWWGWRYQIGPLAEAGFRVTGRVQGVGYRWWARAQAVRLGLAGAVWNADDGSVEVHARGSDASLAELERLLAQGPPHARVARVERVPASLSSEDATGFQIVR